MFFYLIWGGENIDGTIRIQNSQRIPFFIHRPPLISQKYECPLALFVGDDLIWESWALQSLSQHRLTNGIDHIRRINLRCFWALQTSLWSFYLLMLVVLGAIFARKRLINHLTVCHQCCSFFHRNSWWATQTKVAVVKMTKVDAILALDIIDLGICTQSCFVAWPRKNGGSHVRKCCRWIELLYCSSARTGLLIRTCSVNISNFDTVLQEPTTKTISKEWDNTTICSGLHRFTLKNL